MLRLMLALTIGVAFSPSIAQAKQQDVSLGSGHRGLRFTQIEDGANYTMAFGCDLKPGFPLSGGFIEGPNSPIILKETLSPEYRKTLPFNFFGGWSDHLLFSFGPNKAFHDKDLFAIEDSHIRIYPGQTQAEARKVYGLSTNQMFLGAFEGRFYWWVKGKPREVFFRADNHTFKFTLHKRVTEPLGIAKGDPEGDLALDTVVIPKGWYPSPRTFEWIILNLKDAKQID